ncbi:MAG: trehalose-6-phosphate synthase, partial [Dehalococcoidia bacterium]
ERLRAVAGAYRRGARFGYAGFASPTREGVAAYGPLREAIGVAAAEAERAAGDAGCPFIQQSASMPWGQVVALQRSADVVFTSSLADGMNLVPLQAAFAQSAKPAGERAVVLCGVGTGVAEAYADCVGEGLAIVDPLDGEAMVTALEEALAGRPGRVTDRTIGQIRGRDARHWATGYLSDLMGTQR